MGDNWECPDLFPLGEKDILIISPQNMKSKGNDYNNLHSCIYMVGSMDFDTRKFLFDDYYPVDYGFSFYAPQTAMDSKGRRIIAGWMTMWEKEYPTHTLGHSWAGAMTIPREVLLRHNKLYFKPVEEIKKCRKNQISMENIKLDGEKTFEIGGDSYELKVVFDAGEASEFGLKLRAGDIEETVLSYNKKDGLFSLNVDKSGIGTKGERRTEVQLENNKLTLQIFVDKCSVEVFINEGEKVMTSLIYPNKDSVKIKAFSKGEAVIDIFKKWDI